MFEKGQARLIDPALRVRVANVLAVLDAASSALDLAGPRNRLHELQGDYAHEESPASRPHRPSGFPGTAWVDRHRGRKSAWRRTADHKQPRQRKSGHIGGNGRAPVEGVRTQPRYVGPPPGQL